MRKPALALLCAVACAAAASAQEYDRLLPDTTAAYISIENVARTRERFKDSPLEALWKDEKIQAFLEKPLKAWAKSMEKEHEDEVGIDDLLGVLSGQAVLAIGGTSEKPQFTLVADVGGNEEKLRELMEREGRHLVDNEGYERGEEDFRGVNIVSYDKPGEKLEWSDRHFWCMEGKLFIVGTEAELVRQVLIRKEGDAETTLADREVYRKSRGRLGGRADLFFYVDGLNLFKMLTAGEKTPQDIQVWTLVRALGLGSIEAICGEFSLKPRSIDFHGFMSVTGKKEGVLKLLDGKNSALTPPRYIPPDADIAAAMSLDLNAIWLEVRKVMDRMQPGLTGTIDQQLEMIKQQTGVDIQKDLIGAIGEEVSYYVKMPEKPAQAAPGAGFNPMLNLPNFVMAFQLKDKQRFETALANLLAQAAGLVAPQNYLGTKMYVVNIGMGMAPALAILPDRLIFGMNADDVKEVISRQGKEGEVKSLLDNEAHQAALAELPAQRMVVSISNEARTMRQGFLGGMIGGMAGGASTGVDMSLFPEVEVLEKYLGLSTTCLVNEEDGVSYSYVLRLKPQEEEED